MELLTGEPVIKLVAYTEKPYDLAIAGARTCYSPKLVFPNEVDDSHRQRIGKSIYEAGHHTPFQHPVFIFGFENISRQFTWSFLHSHPYYNSTQSSQRYNVLGEARAFVPPLEGNALSVYKKAVLKAWSAYNELFHLLLEDSRKTMEAVGRVKGLSEKQVAAEAERKATENARYVVPVAAFTSMYHAVSGVVLHRYLRMANSGDCPYETNKVVRAMVEEVEKVDPLFFDVVREEPMEFSALPEHRKKPEGLSGNTPAENIPENAKDSWNSWREEFDAGLGGRISKLVSCNSGGEQLVASAVREVLGLSSSAMGDDEAIDLAVNPAKNPLLLDTLNSWTHSPIARALNHVAYVFRKKISHTADSQDQRHRTTPASRPLLTKTHSRKPDYITPEIIKKNPRALEVYEEAVEKLWDAKNALIASGVSNEFACYLLPNATAIRFTESGSFLNLLHKWRMRTCFNSQLEIFTASIEEVEQVRAVHPRLAKYVGPACFFRKGLVEDNPLTGPCPEGRRWCGVPVWINFPKVKRPF